MAASDKRLSGLAMVVAGFYMDDLTIEHGMINGYIMNYMNLQPMMIWLVVSDACFFFHIWDDDAQ